MHPAAKPPALIPTANRSLPLAVAAKGARIFDESGRDYIDASSGPLAVSLGHGHPKVLAALRRQFEAVDYVHRTQFRNQAAEQLADLVTDRLGGGLDHVLFVGSGSEANEVAMKAAHMYWASLGRPDKHRFASSSVSYHGNTVGALGASGQPRYAAAYRPLVQPGERLTAPQLYRLQVPAGSTAEAACIARLRDDFARLDARRTAAVLLEGVGGSGSGVLVPPPGYLEELRRLCDASDILWICDEVMSGFGRSGAWFAFQHANAVPDIVTFAKGPAAAPCRSAAPRFLVTSGSRSAGSTRPCRPATRLPTHRSRARPASPPSRSSKRSACCRGSASAAAGWASGCGRCRTTSRSSATSVASATCGAWSSSPTRRRPRRLTPPST